MPTESVTSYPVKPIFAAMTAAITLNLATVWIWLVGLTASRSVTVPVGLNRRYPRSFVLTIASPMGSVWGNADLKNTQGVRVTHTLFFWSLGFGPAGFELGGSR
jgi:hypothetical protein